MAKGAIRTGKRSAGRPALAAGASRDASRSEQLPSPALGARLGPLRQPSAPLRTKIIAALRSAIETGVLVPGQRLIEKDLCEQLGVSRTSLREALREVQAEGILEYSASRSLCVSSVSMEDAKNIYRLRSVL